MRRDNIADIYPLSPMQEGMLFDALYAPESRVYFQQEGFTIKGRLDVPALRRAWEEVLARHDVLRTAFVWERRDKPLQIVYRRVELPWDYLDWRATTTEDEQRAQLDKYFAADRQQGFDLSKAPLIRLTLVQLADEVFYFIWRFHHTILDKWSVSLLFTEVTALYDAFSRGRSIELKETHPFRGYISWLRRQDTALAEKFWRESLAGLTRPTPFRVERTPGRAPQAIAEGQQTAAAEGQPHRRIVKLSKESTGALQSLARQNQLTLNTLVQGAWALLLSRYSGEEAVAFGSVVSGRPAELTGADEMVGMFINNLPVRVRVSPCALLPDWLKELQAQQAVARQFEYSPLVQVQGWSEVPRGLPLFESFIAFENIPMDSGSITWGGDIEVRSSATFDSSHFPLSVLAWPGEELQLDIGADGRRFDSATHARLAGHLEAILKEFVADPRRRLSELSLLTAAERDQLLGEWNATAVMKVKSPRCLQELFEAQAARRPEAVALVFEDERLTYRELNERANQLAHYLRSLGVGPEVLVGIYMERSHEIVVGILGILKAGGAYLPLDVAYPKERLAFMLADAHATVLLTQEHLLENLPAGDAKIICLDSDWQRIAGESVENPSSVTTPDNLAYTIYTSGSTGQPKGVLVTHANVARLFDSTDEYFHFTASDVWTMFHSHAFDFSVWEMWGALLYGGRVVVVPYLVSRSPEAFYELLLTEQVSVLNQTPSAFRQLLLAAGEISEAETSAEPLAGNTVKDGEDSSRPGSRGQLGKPALRLLIFGGEALEFSWLRPWFDMFGDAQPQLVNMYGITETTVHVTYRRLTAADAQHNGASLIGRHMPDLQTYVLDEQLRLVPVGVPGEIYVGGDGLARGYLNRAELTAARFIPNPFGELPGSRLYRTGDAGRFLEDGEIEYQGRIDQQVKIRGFRIELGEIEAALAQFPGVHEVVVTAHEYLQGETRLVAYIVPGAQHAEAVNELLGASDAQVPDDRSREGALPLEITGHARRFLQEKLPEYMIPSVFVVLDALPLTAHGKVDRAALPIPDQKRSASECTYVAPRTPVEEKLVEMWCELLGVEGIGIHDSFYELGGHSLLLTRLATRINQTFNVELPLRALFNAPTIVELTTAIAARQVEQEDLADAAQLIEELRHLSPEEVAAMLEAEVGDLLEA
jgi:non-ribosomal peptide synthetase component F/acyl carrier protein